MGERCAFKASFPTIQGAIKISGDGGMRLTLEVPESELDNAAPVLRMRGEVLKITVETETH